MPFVTGQKSSSCNTYYKITVTPKVMPWKKYSPKTFFQGDNIITWDHTD